MTDDNFLFSWCCFRWYQGYTGLIKQMKDYSFFIYFLEYSVWDFPFFLTFCGICYQNYLGFFLRQLFQIIDAMFFGFFFNKWYSAFLFIFICILQHSIPVGICIYHLNFQIYWHKILQNLLFSLNAIGLVSDGPDINYSFRFTYFFIKLTTTSAILLFFPINKFYSVDPFYYIIIVCFLTFHSFLISSFVFPLSSVSRSLSNLRRILRLLCSHP